MNKKAIIKTLVKEFIKKSLNSKDVDKMVDKMIKSGAVDLDDYDPDVRGMALPKNMVCAISKQLYQDWAPLDKADKKEINNLYSVL